MISLLVAMALGQNGVMLMDDGTKQGQVTRLNFTGAGVSCALAATGSTQGVCTIPGGGTGGGSGGAPTDAPYITFEATAGLSAERVLTNGTNTTVDIGTAGQAKVNLSGTVPQSLGGTGTGALTCSSGQVLTSNGTAYACTSTVTASTNANLSGPVTSVGNATAIASGAVSNSMLERPYSGVGACSVGSFVSTLNADGAPTCTTPAAGSANAVEASISLTEGGFYSVVVTGQTWVGVSSKIVCQPFGSTADGLTPEAVAVGELSVSTSDRVAGTGFTINVYSPNGLTGTVRLHCTGV